MSRQSDESLSEERTIHESVTPNRSQIKQPPYLLVAWILLLLLGCLFLFGSLSDLVSDARMGLPSDHLDAFKALTGVTWASAQQASKITSYVTQLEIAYAVHELVFGLLFLIIVAIPFRRHARWAWWTCWIPMLANITYSLTIAHFSTTTLAYSLIADIALPVLLLIHIPAFFGKARKNAPSPRYEREAG